MNRRIPGGNWTPGANRKAPGVNRTPGVIRRTPSVIGGHLV